METYIDYRCSDCQEVFLTINNEIEKNNAFDVLFEEELQKHKLDCSCATFEDVHCEYCGEHITSFNSNIIRDNGFSAWLSQEVEQHERFCVELRYINS